MTSHFLFVTGSDSQSIVQRLYKLKDNRCYTELYVSLIEIDDLVANAIIDVLKNKERTWEGIHLAHCTGQVDIVISSALALGSVQRLTLLPDGGTVNDKCLYALASGLPTNQSVTSLVIRVDLYKELATTLAEGLSTNTGLQELSLILSTSDASAIAALARGIQTNSTLRSLKLNRCSLEDGHVADLVRALENHPSLSELSVQGSSCRAMGIIAVSGLLKESSDKPLKLELDLSNQDFEEDEMFGISFLAPSLPSNKSMRFLDLSSNHLTDADVTCLASALSENSTLEELRLVNCNISEKGAKILAAKLPQMRGLKTLWLYGNLFGRAGATALLQAVKLNVHLEQLLLPQSRDDEPMNDIKEEMEYYLILNRGGRQMLTHPQVPSGLWPYALEKAGSVHGDDYDYYVAGQARPNALYCLLQGPVLFSR
jgi:hypothetical protein